MTLEQRIVDILKSSLHPTCSWPDGDLLALAREIVDGLESKGWVIEHQSFSSGDE